MRTDGKFTLKNILVAGERGSRSIRTRAKNSTRNRKVKVSLPPVTFGAPPPPPVIVTLAATGHRPEKLKDVTPDQLAYLAETQIKLERQDTLRGISGMALGWDTVWAQALLRLGVPLIAAVPFVGQADNWPKADRVVYQALLQAATEVVVVSPGRSGRWKFHARNRWMVDHCTKVIALWNGSNGGTGSTVRYAQKVGRPVLNLWDQIK